MEEKVTSRQTVFDGGHYLELIESRGETIRSMVNQLKPVLNLSTALDAGCGVGFFANVLHESGLEVRAFDGRKDNVAEARRRFPQISFEQGDLQSPEIRNLGQFDLVLCFGLLYHLENPLLAMRNLRALTDRGLLLESMCFNEDRPWMLLREEPRMEDQSLTDVAFYASEGCLVKMLYRSGFAAVYRVHPLPDHDDFRETLQHTRRRTVLFAATVPVSLPNLTLLGEPFETSDPWKKLPSENPQTMELAKGFFSKSLRGKYAAVSRRIQLLLPRLPIPVRLPFGAWWLARKDHVGEVVLYNRFETAELSFVDRFLQPGMTAVDIGAHHGLYTLLASRRVGREGRVISFEPSSREQKALLRHIRLNRCRNVNVQACAVGNETMEARLYVVEGRQTGCNSLRPPIAESGTTAQCVHVARLDDWLSEHKIERVDFIKLDVEGGELEALKGANQLLERRPRPVILAEVQDMRTQPWGYAAKEIINYLRDRGYQWFALSPEGLLEGLDVGRKLFDGNFVACPEESVASLRRVKVAAVSGESHSHV